MAVTVDWDAIKQNIVWYPSFKMYNKQLFCHRAILQITLCTDHNIKNIYIKGEGVAFRKIKINGC